MKYKYVALDSPYYQQALDLRYHTFFEAGDYPYDIVRDDEDPEADHLVVLQGEKVVGHARLFKHPPGTARIDHMVIDESLRGKGVGKEVVERLCQKARKLGYDKVMVNSRSFVKGFYEKCGFVVVGEEFHSERTGVPHVEMERVL